MLDGRRDQVTATFRGRNIAVIRDCLASTRSNAIGHLFRDRGILPEPRYLGPQVVHNDPGAAFGEKFDVCPPKPATCASHNRDLSLQRNSFCHLAILLPARLNASARNRDTNCRGAMSLWQYSRPPQSTMRPLRTSDRDSSPDFWSVPATNPTISCLDDPAMVLRTSWQ